MTQVKKRSAARLGGLLALVLGAAALLALPGVAAAKDSNRDGIPDRWEKTHHLSLDVTQARRDQDHDGLRNRAEFRAGDNPRKDDSDGDGVKDGDENAGTIASFDAASGKLTISLFGGEKLSGIVAKSTRIKCEGVEHPGGDDRRLAESGSGHPEPGDDHGGQGEDPGDDNGGATGGNKGSTACNSASLVPGAVVQEAEVRASGGVATFEEVELAHTK